MQPKEWYRTPLSSKDHCVALIPEMLADELAWCGRALGVCRDWAEGEEYAGLWYTNRKAAHCAECNKKEKEWYARLKYGY